MQEHRLLGDIEVYLEDTYNIIEVKEKNINIDIKIVGGRRFPISELVEKIL